MTEQPTIDPGGADGDQDRRVPARRGAPSATSASITLERSVANVRAARDFVTRLAEVLLPPSTDLSRGGYELALMVSELVTNAIEHGDGEVTLTMKQADGGIRVEIRDDGDGEPVRRYSTPGAFTGRGLEIVERLSTSWGWEEGGDETGKTVWFEYPAGDVDQRR